jgi:hypothetical protein
VGVSGLAQAQMPNGNLYGNLGDFTKESDENLVEAWKTVSSAIVDSSFLSSFLAEKRTVSEKDSQKDVLDSGTSFLVSKILTDF